MNIPVFIRRLRTAIFKKIGVFTLLVFSIGQIPPFYFTQKAHAQSIPAFNLPSPGSMISMSNGFAPPIIRGLTLHADNPLRFDFIVDTGDDDLEGEVFEREATRLIKYFLASLTVPEKDLWVNLSPYEKDRIIPRALSFTEMGVAMLAQDYLLKQLSASLMFPESDLGREFWERIYQEIYEKHGEINVPVNTFHKVWIVPGEAVVYAKGNTAYVVKSRLKVMLEQDYAAGKEAHQGNMKEVLLDFNLKEQDSQHGPMAAEIMRETILPAIEREVNEGKHFALLRQIYHSLVLATWFKRALKGNLLTQVYVDQNIVQGIDFEDKEIKEKIYQQYLEAFRKGVFNFIQEDFDPLSKEAIPRKYFSGGVNYAGDISRNLQVIDMMPEDAQTDYAMLIDNRKLITASVNLMTPLEGNNDVAMISRDEDVRKLTAAGITPEEAKGYMERLTEDGLMAGGLVHFMASYAAFLYSNGIGIEEIQEYVFGKIDDTYQRSDLAAALKYYLWRTYEKGDGFDLDRMTEDFGISDKMIALRMFFMDVPFEPWRKEERLSLEPIVRLAKGPYLGYLKEVGIEEKEAMDFLYLKLPEEYKGNEEIIVREMKSLKDNPQIDQIADNLNEDRQKVAQFILTDYLECCFGDEEILSVVEEITRFEDISFSFLKDLVNGIKESYGRNADLIVVYQLVLFLLQQELDPDEILDFMLNVYPPSQGREGRVFTDLKFFNIPRTLPEDGFLERLTATGMTRPEAVRFLVLKQLPLWGELFATVLDPSVLYVEVGFDQEDIEQFMINFRARIEEIPNTVRQRRRLALGNIHAIYKVAVRDMNFLTKYNIPTEDAGKFLMMTIPLKFIEDSYRVVDDLMNFEKEIIDRILKKYELNNEHTAKSFLIDYPQRINDFQDLNRIGYLNKYTDQRNYVELFASLHNISEKEAAEFLLINFPQKHPRIGTRSDMGSVESVMTLSRQGIELDKMKSFILEDLPQRYEEEERQQISLQIVNIEKEGYVDSLCSMGLAKGRVVNLLFMDLPKYYGEAALGTVKNIMKAFEKLNNEAKRMDIDAEEMTQVFWEIIETAVEGGFTSISLGQYFDHAFSDLNDLIFVQGDTEQSIENLRDISSRVLYLGRLNGFGSRFTEFLDNLKGHTEDFNTQHLIEYLGIIHHVMASVDIKQPQATDFDMPDEDDKTRILTFLFENIYHPQKLKAIFDFYFNSDERDIGRQIDQYEMRFERRNTAAFYENMDEEYRRVHRQQERKLDYNFFVLFMSNFVDKETTLVRPEAEIFFKLYTSTQLHRWRALKMATQRKADSLAAGFSDETLDLLPQGLQILEKKWSIKTMGSKNMNKKIQHGDERVYQSFVIAEEMNRWLDLFEGMSSVPAAKREVTVRDLALEWKVKILGLMHDYLEAEEENLTGIEEQINNAMRQFGYHFASRKPELICDIFDQYIPAEKKSREQDRRLLVHYASQLPVNQDGKTVFDSYFELLKFNRQYPEVITSLYHALINEAKGEFKRWRYQSPDYLKMFEAWARKQRDLGTSEAEIKERREEIKSGWERNRYFVVKGEDGKIYHIGFTDNFPTLVNIGNPKHFRSCQATYKPAYNRGVSGTVSNGWNKAVVVFDNEGNFLSRRLVRLRLDTDGEVKLMREGTYGDTDRNPWMEDFLRIVASETGLRYHTDQGDYLASFNILLWAGNAGWEYSDLYGRQFTENVGLIRIKEGEELQASIQIPLQNPPAEVQIPKGFSEESEEIFKMVADRVTGRVGSEDSLVEVFKSSIPRKEIVEINGNVYYLGVLVRVLPKEKIDTLGLSRLDTGETGPDGDIYHNTEGQLFRIEEKDAAMFAAEKENKDAAILTSPGQKGGIDFDPALIDLKAQGDDVRFDISSNPVLIGNIRAYGLTPVIFRLTLVTSLSFN